MQRDRHEGVVIVTAGPPGPLTEPCFHAFLRLWAFFLGSEELTVAAVNSPDIERKHQVSRHLATDWERLHPRVRAWISASDSWWLEVTVAWGPGSNDERRRAHLRSFFRPQFVALSRIWKTDGAATGRPERSVPEVGAWRTLAPGVTWTVCRGGVRRHPVAPPTAPSPVADEVGVWSHR